MNKNIQLLKSSNNEFNSTKNSNSINSNSITDSINNVDESNNIIKYNSSLQRKLNIIKNINKNDNIMNIKNLIANQLRNNYWPEMLLENNLNSKSKIIRKTKNSRSILNINLTPQIDSSFKHYIKIFIGTWNMMGRAPPSDISPFIDISKENYHIVAIGTQECGKNITEAMIFPSCEEWEDALQKELTKKYQLIKSETMGALHLAIFINRECSSHIKSIY